jgi:hypothetical protein
MPANSLDPLRISALRPFVPSGKRYEEGRRLFADLGFEELWEKDGYAGFASGHAGFILQALEDEKFAGSLMIRIDVDDLDAWWTAVSGKRLESKYPGFRIRPPDDYPWGREVMFIDLAGVCWHVGLR